MNSVDDLIIKILGKWCEHCQRVTKPYLSENNKWPCCNGCWHEYSYWDTHSDFDVLKKEINVTS